MLAVIGFILFMVIVVVLWAGCHLSYMVWESGKEEEAAKRWASCRKGKKGYSAYSDEEGS